MGAQGPGGRGTSFRFGEAAVIRWTRSPRSPVPSRRQGVRYIVIGVWGANYYAPSGTAMFLTLDRDLFLPADPDNLLEAWRVCEANGFGLFVGMEPLDRPRDGLLAKGVVGRRALTRASDGAGTDVELSLVMSGFDFEEVWPARRMFEVEGVANSRRAALLHRRVEGPGGAGEGSALSRDPPGGAPAPADR